MGSCVSSAVYLRCLVLAVLVTSGAACESAIDLIKEAEGFRACEYVDSTGHPTICYGFNLVASGAQAAVEAVGGDYNKVLHGGCLSESQCTQLLSTDVNRACSDSQRVFGSQCSCIANVLCDMTYNLGESGISSFTTFRSYIEAHNWSAAASDIKGTLWCSQVGNRCTRDAGIIAGGCGSLRA